MLAFLLRAAKRAWVTALVGGALAGAGCALIAGVEDGELAAAPGGTGGVGAGGGTGAMGGAGADGGTGGSGGTGTGGSGEAGASAVGVKVRGTDQYQSDNTESFSLTPPALSEVGDFTWAIILRTGHPPPDLTVPDGFQERHSSSYVCGYRSAALDIYSHVVDGSEPSTYDFVNASQAGVTALLISFEGLSGMVAASAHEHTLSNPMALPPLANGNELAYGFGVFTSGWTLESRSFSIPAGKTRLVQVYNMALFGDDVQPSADFVNDQVEMTPEGCGFAYAALLNRS